LEAKEKKGGSLKNSLAARQAQSGNFAGSQFLVSYAFAIYPLSNLALKYNFA